MFLESGHGHEQELENGLTSFAGTFLRLLLESGPALAIAYVLGGLLHGFFPTGQYPGWGW